MKKIYLSGLVTILCIALQIEIASASPVPIVNAGFEDISGQVVLNEYTFGIPTGWSLYDPNNVTASSDIFTGTFQPNGIEFYNQLAPEGSRVAMLKGLDAPNTGLGNGEYGYMQTLVSTLAADTRYDLSVEVGNIASGIDTNGTFFNLDEFPGYRIDLLAGDQIIALDDDNLLIPEGDFMTANLSFTVGQSHALMGQALGIRLVNLNQIPVGFKQFTSPGLEVEFDDVRLTTTSLSVVPVPAAFWLFGTALIGLVGFGKRRKNGLVLGQI